MEGTIHPDAAAVERWVQEDPDAEAFILNLLKFSEGGRAAYAAYLADVSGPLTDLGVEIVYLGDCEKPQVAPAGFDWDAVLVTRYPSRAAYGRIMQQSRENPEKWQNRGVALAATVVQPTRRWSLGEE